MKLNDLTNENLNEGPFDLLTKSGRANRRAFKSGQKTLKLTADNLKKQFAKYLGSKGKKNFRQATGEDVKDFLDSKKVDVSLYNIPDGVLQSGQLDKILQDASKDAIQGKGGKPLPQQEPVSSAYAQAKDAALQLNAKEKRRLIQQLEKSIKSKPAKKTTVVDKNFDKSQRLSAYGKVGK